jgi:hypothetical protein
MIFIIILTLLGVGFIYFLYKFLSGSSTVASTAVIVTDTAGTSGPINVPAIPQPYEGGDYSVSTWVYINSYNVNRNRRKHIIELAGPSFSTLLIGLGAFKNTLMVRTHSRDNSSSTPTTVATTAAANATVPSNQTPSSEEAGRYNSSLTTADLDSLFQPLAMDDALINTSPVCDLPEIDMQRWVLITVVLSGRIIDTYIDGKLARSCVTPSYFKVDPAGVKMKVLERGGFDGHVSTSGVYPKALLPSDVYNIYLAGPTGTSTTTSGWFSAIFTGK